MHEEVIKFRGESPFVKNYLADMRGGGYGPDYMTSEREEQEAKRSVISKGIEKVQAATKVAMRVGVIAGTFALAMYSMSLNA